MIRRDIYNKIKSIVDGYRQSGVSALGIKKYFSSRRNFKDLVSSLSTTQWDLEKRQPDVDFENLVREILFDRILQDRIYYERDNPITENKISKLYLEKLALKDDPFGEEHWGYEEEVNESIENMDLTKYFITYNNVEEMIEIAKFLIKNKYRVYNYYDIIDSVVSEWDGYHFDGEEFLRCSDGFAQYRTPINLYELKSMLSRKKIKNIEKDPFGEEFWGYEKEMNENKNEDWTEINFRDLINKFGIGKSIELLNNYCVYKRVIYVADSGEKVYLGRDGYFTTQHFRFTVGNNIKVNMVRGGSGIPKSLIFVDKIPNILCGLKRVRNLKVDPFDEENWGYEEE